LKSSTLRPLMEFGDRSPALNRELGQEVSRAGEHLVGGLSRGDRLAVWKYNDRVEKVPDFSQHHEALDTFFLKLGTPELWETNLIYTTPLSSPWGRCDP
jgi:hypothetical protein